MTLAAGSRLGPYEIVAPLGAGGMGEVWRARDPRLGREVAIKVLPAVFAADPDRMARFDREARMLAALNHPHIAAIYGIEEVDGTRAIVQELVDGPTLASRLEAGALPVEEALAIARQIAEALEAAHDRGIVHRDLKPGNVKLTPAGIVKVLDFGLARAMDDDSGGPSMLSQSPTLSHRMTEAGMILGTAAYMSPEQAKGRAADRRADIWSFGVVLFEMLTGRRLFEGETASETMASVMKDAIDLEQLPSTTPPRIRALLERCLIRDPRQRLQSIGEARIALENPSAMGVAGPPIAPARTNPNRLAVAGVVLGIALISAGIGAWLAKRSQPPKSVRKYPVALSERRQEVADAVISPDGRWLAFFIEDSLWVRDLQTLQTRAVTRGHSSMRPVWSPDSRQIGFTDGVRMWRAAVEGGALTPIGAIPPGTRGTGASWREDGKIFLAFGAGGLFELTSRTGTVHEVLPIDSTSSDFHEPLVLPGGAVAYIRHRRASGTPDRIAVWNGKNWHDVYSSEDYLSHMCWSTTGHLLFQQMGSAPGVWALPLSPRTLRATGEAFLLASGAAFPSMSDAGTLVYAEGLSAARTVPCWWDSARGLVRIPGEDFGRIQNVSLSPNGRTAAYNTPNERGFLNVWSMDVRTGAHTRRTFANENQYNPVWSWDGREILYATQESGSFAIPASGGEDPVRIASGLYPNLAPDDRHLCFTRDTGSTRSDLYVVTRGVDTLGVPLVIAPGAQIRPEVRPDGRLVAYMSEETGRFEIFLTRFPTGQGRWQVSTIGARRQRWSADGRRLYFQSADAGQLWVSEISDSDDPVPGTPRRVVDLTRYGVQVLQGRNFDIGPDGRIFLFTTPTLQNGAGDVVMVENWFEEFRKK